ncbi:MAG: hypothetical protein U9R25_19560 [Chloroflexota bacterium]|nr:hypothetical protein [Chloroflexota bacterium]
MDTGLVSRIIKARQYAQERDRVEFNRFEATFEGEHNTYRVTYEEEGRWHCTCEEAVRMGVCSHIMALERILGDSVMPAQNIKPAPAPAS